MTMNPPNSMDIQQKQQLIESELLEVIVSHLKSHQLDVATASRLAKDFLQALPLQDQEDLLAKLKILSNKYPLAQPIYALELSKVSREKELHAVQKMTSLIKEGNIEHAISVAKSLQTKPK